MSHSYSTLEKKYTRNKSLHFPRSLSTHFLGVLNCHTDFKILSVRHAKVRYFRKQKSQQRMGFIQSFVKICQLVKAAMGHAHIDAQHTLYFPFGSENTPKTITPYSFGLLSIRE